jgi:hypothetical protein
MAIEQSILQAQYRQDLGIRANIIENACDNIDKFFYVLQQGISDGSIKWKDSPYKHMNFKREVGRQDPYDADTLEEMYARKICNFLYFGMLKAQGHYGILHSGKLIKGIDIVQQDGRFSLKDVFRDGETLMFWLPQTNEIAMINDKSILDEIDLSIHMYFVLFDVGYKTIL